KEGASMIYLDNAVTTKPSKKAFDRATEYATDKYFNPSALYREGFALQSELKKARSVLLSKVADETAFEWIFTSCGTESDNQAIFSFARRGNAVTTAGEHSAVEAAFHELKVKGIAEPRFAPLQKDGRVDVQALLRLLDEKTSFVSVMHVNNEIGAINDVNAIAKAVKQKNSRVIFHVDGVQAYGKIPFKLCKEIDLYSVSAHKIGGLKGVGGLIKRKSLVLPPYIIGGGQESGRRSGTENTFGIMQFVYAAEEKFSTLKEDWARLTEYRALLWDSLAKEVYTRLSTEESSPYILSVSAVGLRGEVLLHMANDKGLIIGTGSACSSNVKTRYSKVILACGFDEKTADGVLRISFSAETTKEEVLRAAEILNEVGRALKERMK
ncbi:MAG: cysteine desulfurase, partial [Clostridia bacterium]|nr:cysteine desulfurase [Clostridia bacterium]